MKIDTQGMSLSLDSNYKETKSVDEQREEIPKTTIQPTRLFTPEYVKEMKILINEVLDEREYNKKMKGAYDIGCLLYTSPSPRDRTRSRMPSSA